MKYLDKIQVYDKAEELANRERKPVSEIVVRALEDYLHVHYPGQPQPPLLMTEAKIRRYMVSRVKARLTHLLEKPWPNADAWHQAIASVLNKLPDLRLQDKELDALVDRALAAVNGRSS